MKSDTANQFRVKDKQQQSLTWHGLLVVVFKPSEESIHCGEYLGAIPEPIWSDGHILYPVR